MTPPASDSAGPNPPLAENGGTGGDSGRPRIVRGNPGRLSRLCAKELREILRDRRTIVTLILMPLLVYPVLSLTFNTLLVSSFQTASESEIIIGFSSQRQSMRFDVWLKAWSQRLGEDVTLEPDDDEPRIGAYVHDEGVRKKVADGLIDLGVIVKPVGELPDGAPDYSRLDIELVYRDRSQLSESALRFLERRLDKINAAYDRNELKSSLPSRHSRAAITAEQGAAFSFAAFVPLILILMTITGAVYPAIDLTAGERERGTMEALIAAPIPRLGLLLAKYVAVLTVALLTATANLVAMTITLMTSSLANLLFGDGGFSLVAMAQVFSLMVLFAAFFSAVLLAITSFARSFKEAQAYLIPLMLLSLGPGVVSLMPGIELTRITAVTPLLNIVLLARDTIQGTAHPLMAAAAVISTCIYALAAIAVAARIFGTDAILYGSQQSWSDLFRRPRVSSDHATIAAALMCLALIFPLQFLSVNLAQKIAADRISVALLLGGLLTMLLFFIIPLIGAGWQNVQVTRGFQIRPGHWGAYVGGLILGLSLWPFAMEIVLIGRNLGLTTLDAEALESIRAVGARFQEVPLPVLLISIAVAPALFEEFFFRGMLLRALQVSMRPAAAIGLSAAVFGAFHLIGQNTVTIEKLLPSTFLGLFLGWVCVRSGSILPGVLLHLCHNGLMILVAHFSDELESWGLGGDEAEHLPAEWLIGAALAVIVGVAVIAWATRGGASRRNTDASDA